MKSKPPTPTQMKALQHLRDGRLILRTPSYPFLNDVAIEADRTQNSGLSFIGERTAKILIERRWVELKKFNPRKGEYRLTAEGKELSDEFCGCRKRAGMPALPGLLSGIDPEATNEKFDWANERLLCRRCWRRIACAGKFFKHLHGANRLSSLGPICQKHFEQQTAVGRRQ